MTRLLFCLSASVLALTVAPGVAVFDVLGRQVAEAGGAFEPGTHAVRLATDRLVPGAYVVRVEATGSGGVAVESRRLTVVR